MYKLGEGEGEGGRGKQEEAEIGRTFLCDSLPASDTCGYAAVPGELTKLQVKRRNIRSDNQGTVQNGKV